MRDYIAVKRCGSTDFGKKSACLGFAQTVSHRANNGAKQDSHQKRSGSRQKVAEFVATGGSRSF